MTPQPITSQHLREAIAWAREATKPTDIAGTRREYKQDVWDCGTACCLHGAAHLIARGEEAKNGPDTNHDYADLPPDIRGGVWSVLNSIGGTPDLLERVLDGELKIGRGVQILGGVRILGVVDIGRGVEIGGCTDIGADVTIGDGAKIGRNAEICDDATIAPGAKIPHGTTVAAPTHAAANAGKPQ